MAVSQNGYSVRESSVEVERWQIPVRGEPRHVYLRRGHTGFILAYFLLWFHERVERINTGVWDDWGWAYRAIRGSSSGYSNHASGTAVDINATRHPLSVHNTFKARWQVARIHYTLRRLKGVIRWGGDYNGRVDEMHFEINKRGKVIRKVAHKLRKTRRGRRVWAANSHYMHPQWERIHKHKKH